MRRLEGLLLVGSLVLSYLTYVDEPNEVAALVLLGLLVAHVVINKPRWQLTVAYIIGSASIVIAGLNVELSGWVNHVLFWGGIVGLVLTVSLAIGLPIMAAPEVTGPYWVGTSTFHLDQMDRDEIHSEHEGDTRQLMLQVWYPAAESLNPVADYLPDGRRGARAMTKAAGMPRFGLDHLDLIRPNGRTDAPLAQSESAFPVLLFSHGRSGTRGQNTFQVEELVSHGYVVAAVDHPYGSGYTIYPDGRLIDYDHSIFGDDSPEVAGVVIDEWVKDLQCVLDTLEEFNEDAGGPFEGALAIERVGVFGHSAGGGTAFELCHRDERCGPVLGYDPWVVPVSDEAIAAGLEQPMMVLKQPVPLGPTSDRRLQALITNTTAPTAIYDVDGTKHLDFNDFKLLAPALEWVGVTGDIDGDQLLEIMNEFTRGFFDTYLRGFPLPPVLQGDNGLPAAKLRAT